MIGWAVVAAAVAGYDGWAIVRGAETMSRAYRRTYGTHPVLVAAATAYLVGHLTGHLPSRYDVLRRLCP